VTECGGSAHWGGFLVVALRLAVLDPAPRQAVGPQSRVMFWSARPEMRASIWNNS